MASSPASPPSGPSSPLLNPPSPPEGYGNPTSPYEAQQTLKAALGEINRVFQVPTDELDDFDRYLLAKKEILKRRQQREDDFWREFRQQHDHRGHHRKHAGGKKTTGELWTMLRRCVLGDPRNKLPALKQVLKQEHEIEYAKILEEEANFLARKGSTKQKSIFERPPKTREETFQAFLAVTDNFPDNKEDPGLGHLPEPAVEKKVRAPYWECYAPEAFGLDPKTLWREPFKKKRQIFAPPMAVVPAEFVIPAVGRNNAGGQEAGQAERPGARNDPAPGTVRFPARVGLGAFPVDPQRIPARDEQEVAGDLRGRSRVGAVTAAKPLWFYGESGSTGSEEMLSADPIADSFEASLRGSSASGYATRSSARSSVGVRSSALSSSAVGTALSASTSGINVPRASEGTPPPSQEDRASLGSVPSRESTRLALLRSQIRSPERPRLNMRDFIASERNLVRGTGETVLETHMEDSLAEFDLDIYSEKMQDRDAWMFEKYRHSAEAHRFTHMPETSKFPGPWHTLGRLGPQEEQAPRRPGDPGYRKPHPGARTPPNMQRIPPPFFASGTVGAMSDRDRTVVAESLGGAAPGDDIEEDVRTNPYVDRETAEMLFGDVSQFQPLDPGLFVPEATVQHLMEDLQIPEFHFSVDDHRLVREELVEPPENGEAAGPAILIRHFHCFVSLVDCEEAGETLRLVTRLFPKYRMMELPELEKWMSERGEPSRRAGPWITRPGAGGKQQSVVERTARVTDFEPIATRWAVRQIYRPPGQPWWWNADRLRVLLEESEQLQGHGASFLRSRVVPHLQDRGSGMQIAKWRGSKINEACFVRFWTRLVVRVHHPHAPDCLLFREKGPIERAVSLSEEGRGGNSGVKNEGGKSVLPCIPLLPGQDPLVEVRKFLIPLVHEELEIEVRLSEELRMELVEDPEVMRSLKTGLSLESGNFLPFRMIRFADVFLRGDPPPSGEGRIPAGRVGGLRPLVPLESGEGSEDRGFAPVIAQLERALDANEENLGHSLIHYSMPENDPDKARRRSNMQRWRVVTKKICLSLGILKVWRRLAREAAARRGEVFFEEGEPLYKPYDHSGVLGKVALGHTDATRGDFDENGKRIPKRKADFESATVLGLKALRQDLGVDNLDDADLMLAA